MANRIQLFKTFPTSKQNIDKNNGHRYQQQYKTQQDCAVCDMVSSDDSRINSDYHIDPDKHLDKIVFLKAKANYDLRNTSNDPDVIREQMLKGFWNFLDVSSKNQNQNLNESLQQHHFQHQPQFTHQKPQSRSQCSNLSSSLTIRQVSKAPLRGLLDTGNKQAATRNFQACLISSNYSERLSKLDKKTLLSTSKSFLNRSSIRSNFNSSSIKMKQPGTSTSLSNHDMRTKSSFTFC